MLKLANSGPVTLATPPKWRLCRINAASSLIPHSVELSFQSQIPTVRCPVTQPHFYKKPFAKMNPPHADPRKTARVSRWIGLEYIPFLQAACRSEMDAFRIRSWEGRTAKPLTWLRCPRRGKRFLGDLRSLVRFVSFWKKQAKSEWAKSNHL